MSGNGTAARVQRQVISNVQVLRFFAAFSVLLRHSAYLLIPTTSVFWLFPWSAGVDIFFVISGFIMARLTHGQFGKPGVAGTFLLRRAVRIVPPYWFFTTLMIAAALLASAEVRNATLQPAQILTSYGFIPWPRGDGELNPILSQGWTLNYEAFFYLAFAACLLFRRGLALLAAGFAALVLLHPLVPKDWFALYFLSAPIILEFLGGIGIALLYLRGVRLPLWGSLLCAACAVAAFLVLRQVGLPEGRFLFFGVPAILVCASLILRPEPECPGPIRRALQAGGDASYTIYLSHTFTIHAAAILWRRLGFELPWLGVALEVAISIAAALLFYRLAERPFTHLLERRFGMRPSRGVQAVAP
ncbi:MAG TPA: acyltransferase [Allosphingosinicella sp.]|jgi:peptidoglycan/LPS O-acetylase OafA/YrhL